MDVSIIIVNYNTRDLIKQCIHSIHTFLKEIQFEIIVFDNASLDGTIEMIKIEFPKVKLIQSDINLGFGKANNLAAKQAIGTYLFLLNPDTILIENSLKIIMEFQERNTHRNIAAIGCKLLDLNGNPHISYGNFPSVTQELFEYGLHKIFKNYFNNKLNPAVCDKGSHIKEVDYIIGADLFIKKQIFDEMNGFDEDFFLFYEETELCFRLKKNGYKIIWVPLTSIMHHYSGSGKDESRFNYWILEQKLKSKYLYFEKCQGKFVSAIIKLLTIPKVLIINRKQDFFKVIKILCKTL